MRKTNRRELLLGLAATSIALPMIESTRVAAQGAIPDGVFVRETSGAVWMVVQGQRVAVPFWPAADIDIAAIPKSDLWAVMSVNDDGAIVGGGRPAWYVESSTVAPSIAPPIVTAPSAPAPATDATLTIPEHITYTSKYSPGTVYIAGLVENPGATAIGVKTIAVSLLGPNGETVGSGSAVYKPSFLDPSTRVGWHAVVSNAPSHKEVRVQVESGPAQSSYVPAMSHLLRTEGVTVQPGTTTGRAKMAGQVVNVGDRETGRATIIAALFSATGALLDVNQGHSTIETLGPGQSSPFEVDFFSEGAQRPAKYEVFAEARLKT